MIVSRPWGIEDGGALETREQLRRRGDHRDDMAHKEPAGGRVVLKRVRTGGRVPELDLLERGHQLRAAA